MLEIILIHVKACWRDLRACRLGDLHYERENTRDMVYNDQREWRVG